MPRSLRPQISVSPEEQSKLSKILKKFERKEIKELTSSPKDLMYAIKLIEHYQNVEEKGGHIYKRFVDGPLSIEKYPHHKAFFDATKKYKQVLFRAANRCLAEGTLVATPLGPVEIQNLQPGDYVFDRFGNPTKVLAVWDNGEQDVVNLTNRGKVYATCTPDHEWWTTEFRSKKTKPKRRRAEQLRKSVGVFRKRPKSNLGYVDEPHAYVIGAVLGDGCCREKGLKLAISSADSKIPQKIAEILETTCQPPKHKNYTWKIEASTFNHYEDWMKGRYSHEKYIDLEVVKTWNRKSVLNFVAGLIDTDGSLARSTDHHTLSFHNQSISAIEAFEYCVLALWGESTSRLTDARSKYVNGPVYTSYVRSPHALAVITEELLPYLQHKYKGTLDYNCFGGKRSKADSLNLTASPAGRARVWDITVAHEDHLFLLANGLVTSNCGKSDAGAYAASCWTTGIYPDWWEGRKFFKPTFGLVCGDTNDTVREILQAKLVGSPRGTGFIPDECLEDIVIRPNTGGTADSIIIRHKPSGKFSRIKFKTYEQGPEAFYGLAPDWIWFDEEPTGKDATLIWNQGYTRLLTTKGTMIVTFTPLMGWTPILRDFCDTATDLTPPDDELSYQ